MAGKGASKVVFPQTTYLALLPLRPPPFAFQPERQTSASKLDSKTQPALETMRRTFSH